MKCAGGNGAIRYLKLAAEAEPTSLLALHSLVEAFGEDEGAEAGTYRERFRSLRKARSLSNRVQLLTRRGQDYAAHRNGVQAERLFKEATVECKGCPEAPHLRNNLGLN